LIDITTSYADGFTTAGPFVASSPERWVEIMDDVRGQLITKGRDPENFDFGLFPACCLIHEDENVLDRALDNPITRWSTLALGRINQADWRREGIEPPMPDSWHYAVNLLPMKIGEAETKDLLGRVTREMVEKSWFIGTPAQVAEQLQRFVDVGTTWMHIGDLMPMVLEPEDAAESSRRVIEVSAALKANLSH